MSSEHAGLVVENLRVDTTAAKLDIVADVGFSLAPGTTLGIVGESGCGKTTVAMALLGFARPGTRIVSGSVRVGNIDLLALNDAELRSTRGRVISYVPQNPSRALSPGMRVRAQLKEMIDAHLSSHTRGDELLSEAWKAAQLPTGREYLLSYPHQLSGGQQQRAAIAMALVCEPMVIVMDEPTTGLDVLTQQRLLTVIGDLCGRRDICVVYVSHDLAVVRNLVDNVVVMYGGRIVERGPVDNIFRNPQHPYTRRLLEAIPRVHSTTGRLRGIPGHAVEPWNRPAGCPFAPRCEYRQARCETALPAITPAGGGEARCWRISELPQASHVVTPVIERSNPVRQPLAPSEPLLIVRDLVAGYHQGGSLLRRGQNVKVAVDRVSFNLPPGACLAIVGESGSGKTTLARCLAGLHEPHSGNLFYRERSLPGLARKRDPTLRRRIQIVFQDPDSSLNPSMTVGAIVRRPVAQFFNLGHQEEARRVRELLERVHLAPSIAGRLPRDLSGGEKQRVAIARAIAAEPDLLICDEVTSALDVAVQASILELLEELRKSTGMSILFVTHDLAVVRSISDTVLVMQHGLVREYADCEALFAAPQDDYTRQLLAAAPDLHEDDYPHWSDAVNASTVIEAP